MFSCSACVRKAVFSLVSAHHGTPNICFPLPSLFHLQSETQSSFRFRRNHSTAQSITKPHHRRLIVKALKSKKPILPNRRRTRAVSQVERRDAQARDRNRHHLDVDPEKRAVADERWRVQFL